MSLVKSRGLSLAPLGLLVAVAAVVLSTSGSALAAAGAAGSFHPAADRASSVQGGPVTVPVDPPASLPAVIATPSVGQLPLAAAYDPLNGYVYVANSISDNVSVLDGTSAVGSVDLAPNDTGDPLFVAYDAVNGYVYVVDGTDVETGTGAVSIVQGVSVVGVLAVGSVPVCAVVDGVSGDLYVVNSGSANVTVIDGTAVLATVPVGTNPSWAAYSAFEDEVFVTNSGSANVSVLYGTTVAATVPVGQDPDAAAYDPVVSSQEVYVANGGTDNLSILQEQAVALTLPVGADPSYVAYNPSIQGIDVANTNSSNVSVVETVDGAPSVVANLAVAAGPTALGPGPDAVYTFVVGTDANAVTVLNGTSYVGNVSVGSAPRALAADPANGFEYVVNSGSNTVSVLATAYPVAFNETGLASGSVWSVTLAGSTASSTSSSIGFLEPNGTYAYDVPAPAGYRLVSAVPASPITVAAPGVVVNVTFALLPITNYTVTFNETGLGCSGHGRGYGGSGSGYGSGYGGYDDRGHHGGQGGQCCQSMGQNGQGFEGSSMDGSGGQGGCCRSSSERLSWNVTFDGVTKTTNNTSVSFTVPNGTYDYTVGPPSGYNLTSSVPASPVTVDGANLTVNVTFAAIVPPAIYSITFVEQGLPNGTSWCVTANNSTECASGTEIVFSDLGPGTYGFNVSQVSGYTAQPSSGRVTISDANVTVEVKFSPSGHHHCM